MTSPNIIRHKKNPVCRLKPRIARTIPDKKADENKSAVTPRMETDKYIIGFLYIAHDLSSVFDIPVDICPFLGFKV